MSRDEAIEAELIRLAEELSVRPTLLAAYLIDVYSANTSNGFMRAQNVSDD